MGINMYDYEGYEYKPRHSGFDIALNRIIEKEVRKRCKRLYKEYDSVKAENEQLQDVKERFDEVKYEYESKIRELERAKENIKREIEKDFLKLKYNEMINRYGEVIYVVERKYHDLQKCAKCDEKRQYTFESPDGNIYKHNCNCSKGYHKYVVTEKHLFKATLVKHERQDLKLEMHYREGHNNTTFDSGDYIYRAYKEFKPSNENYNMYYTSQEEAQKHCDYLNSKEGK